MWLNRPADGRGRRHLWWVGLAGGVLVAVLGGGCGDPRRSSGDEAGGDPRRGQLLLRQFGCGSCHTIPGVAVAGGNVGPTLAGVGRRVYLAGVIPNTPQNMIRFIRTPQAISPQTAMPDLQVTEAHAMDMVAYLRALP